MRVYLKKSKTTEQVWFLALYTRSRMLASRFFAQLSQNDGCKRTKLSTTCKKSLSY